MFTDLSFPDNPQLKFFSTTLEPITVFVGDNGCGKTLLLQAIKDRFCAESKDYSQADDHYFHSVNGNDSNAILGTARSVFGDIPESLNPYLRSDGFVSVHRIINCDLNPLRWEGLCTIDDCGNDIHPKRHDKLLEAIRLRAAFYDLQVVISTHSPYFLGKFYHQEVRMMAIGDDGLPRCAKLTDHPKFERWKAEFNPGEMWSLFGDRWVVDGARTQCETS
jgi:predicted ATPase